MKIAIIGSKGMTVPDLKKYLPPETTEIVLGGTKGIDTSAREYALKHSIKLTEFLPDYEKYGQGAPLKRNIAIVEYADMALAFWDGESQETKAVIDACNRMNIPIRVFV